MIRFLIVILLVAVGLLTYGWFSAQSLPSWYDEGQPTHTTQMLLRDVEKRGLANVFGNKLAGILIGEVVFNEPEFNALVLTSLRANTDGRRLLAVSDGINIDLQDNQIEVGAILNVEKLARYEPKAKKAIEQALQFLPMIQNNGLIAVAIKGRPIARNGELAIGNDVSVAIGSFPISNGVLKTLGVKTHKISQESLRLKAIRIDSVYASKNQIKFGIGRK